MRDFDFSKGGRDVINRIMVVYGFRFKADLAKHFKITNSTIATWTQRDFYPSNLVIQCALETGISLQWLATRTGIPEKQGVKTNLSFLDKSILKEGALHKDGSFTVDNSFFPVEMAKPSLVFSNAKRYLIEHDFNELSNGLWLVDIENEVSVKQLEKIPVKRVKVTSEDTAQFFDCAIDDIKILGKVVLTCK